MSPSPGGPSTTLGRTATTIGWGLYGASSWTWCIGMFLPTILLARFGWAGFWAFLIPNVLGCTAFGYLFDAEGSRRFATRHAAAIRWFGLATIAFQVFFIGWAGGTFVYGPEIEQTAGDEGVAGVMRDSMVWPVLGTVLTWTAAAVALGARSDRFWRWFAAVAAIAGGVLFGLSFQRTGGFPDAPTPEDGAPLLFAIPIITLGFLACPTLDATFHRMRQRSPSRHSFAIFGGVFTGMLLFAALSFDGLSPDRIADAALPFILAQWTIQLVFTIGAHVREIPLLPTGRLGAGAAILLAVGIGTLAGLPALADERTYLTFLGCYAIPVPIYVIAAVVAGDRRLRAGAVPMVLAVSVLLAPLGWLGFVENRTMALLPAAALAAIGGWLIGRFGSTPRTPEPA